MLRRATSGERTIDFDRPPAGPALLFSPRVPRSGAEAAQLWWSGPVSPEVIDEVLGLLAGRRRVVEAIVIAGLERYPVSSDEWPRWLVRWGGRGDVPRIIVRTEGLAESDRRRLIRRTCRQAALESESNPVVQLTEAIRDWFVGRSA